MKINECWNTILFISLSEKILPALLLNHSIENISIASSSKINIEKSLKKLDVLHTKIFLMEIMIGFIFLPFHLKTLNSQKSV